MGSFAYTCCVSGFPILAGDTVRFFLLTQSPWTKPAEHTCEIGARWMPRTFPLTATYNDYGSVEGVEEGSARDIWLEGFQIDLITRGTGDNSVHDVPVRKNMSFDELLISLLEGRVLVRDQKGSFFDREMIPIPEGIPDELRNELLEISQQTDRPSSKTPKGIPTLKRVEKAILSTGELVVREGFGKDGYMIDRQSPGFIRVRVGGSQRGEIARLRDLRSKLKKRWATFLTVGTGNYSSREPVLILGPKPKHYKTSTLVEKDKAKALAVAQAMIREDVWQAICSCTFCGFNNKRLSVQTYRDSARELYQEFSRRGPGIIANPGSHAHPLFYLGHNELTGPAWGYHFRRMMKHNPKGEELDRFLDTVGETVFVSHFLFSVRYQWQPGHSSGPQFGEWPSHKNYLEKLLVVAEREVEANQTEDD